MTDDNLIVLAAIRETRRLENIRRAVIARHPSAQFARSDCSPASSGAGPGSAAASRAELDPEQEYQP